MRELRRGLSGREEAAARERKDFHASSVLRVVREWWRVDSREDFWSWVRVLEGGGGEREGERVIGLWEKRDGLRKE